MRHRRDARLGRYGKKSKDLLVNYINEHNGRDLASDQLLFGTPSTKGPDGLTEIEVSFAQSTGWSDEVEIMGYYRVEPSLFLRGLPISVYVSGFTDEDICNAIFEQYGLFIEPEFIILELISQSLADITPTVDLPGFDPEDGEAVPPAASVVPGYLDNRNYKLSFKQTHLIFFGEIMVHTRRALQSLGNPIDSLMDLREFYKDGNMDLPPIDLLIPKGELYVDREIFPEHNRRRAIEAMLHNDLKVDEKLGLAQQVPMLLKDLTGNQWVSSETPAPFNLHGARIVYNGFVSRDQTLEDSGYNFVVAIELGELCDNLTGIVKIGYKYASSDIPGNNPFNQASVLPLFNH